MGLKHPGQGKVVEPACSSGMPDDVQWVARSLMDRPRNDSATPSPSLWLREPRTAQSPSKR